ncbi:MAG: hypothetical protein ACJAVV_001195 [Alphaproteobacteria bacterium]|jgi:hypothetical protein
MQTYKLLKSHQRLAVNTTMLILSVLFMANSHALVIQTANEGKIKTKQNEVNNAVVEYQLLFNQFAQTQILQLQSFMRQYSGYQSDNTIMQNSMSTELKYTTTASKEQLINNLQKTASHLGMQVLVRTAERQINIRFIKLTSKSLPYKQW